ncbi:MAG: hypothetical protein COV46_03635 [Deltaproteobacteria bacterium CG11_big_fil_rev_8_21_14_0_20_49_13]|nr:MAG: hypothetical protein COV46_03635 [Deltaproteobacteria bacterium CG11_big_fil_rev_8_21_14_0_20_49_13]
MTKDYYSLMQDLLVILMKTKPVSDLVARCTAIYQRLNDVIKTDDEFGMDPELLDMVRPVFEFLYEDWFRVEVKDVKNIPLRGPAFVVSNHSGMLPYDAVMLNMAVYNRHPKRRNIRFLVADFVDNFPVISHFIQRAGGVKASPENAAKLLRKGEVVCAFPEGTRGIGKLYSERYKLQDFGKGGVVKLARKTGVPVIPCAIVGAEDIHPILWKFEDLGKKIGLPFFPVTPTFPLFGLVGLIPFPSKWVIKFGKPIYYKRSKKSVETLTRELKGEVQKLIDMELIRRKYPTSSH